jgi:hypothetical protein
LPARRKTCQAAGVCAAGVEWGVQAFNSTSQTLTNNPAVVVTQRIPTSGVYYVNGMAELSVDAGDAANCGIFSANLGLSISTSPVSHTSGNTMTWQSLSMLGAANLNAQDYLVMYCRSDLSDPNTQFFQGGITATLVNNSIGQQPVKAGMKSGKGVPPVKAPR